MHFLFLRIEVTFFITLDLTVNIFASIWKLIMSSIERALHVITHCYVFWIGSLSLISFTKIQLIFVSTKFIFKNVRLCYIHMSKDISRLNI